MKSLVTSFGDMGIKVLEHASEGDDLLLSPNSLDEEAAEEDAIVLITVVADRSRPTSGPLRAYLREMGTGDLLTKDQEVALAKQIEVARIRAGLAREFLGIRFATEQTERLAEHSAR